MKARYLIATVVALALMLSLLPAQGALAGPGTCATIKDGTIKDKLGNTLTQGYDEFGYNYQAHLFNGPYDGFDRKWGNDTVDLADDQLIMKWSDDWLSNMDCNGDGLLDRGSPSSVGYPSISQGWLTNNFHGDYDSDGNGSQDAQYTDFVKIVWVGPGGSLWGQYEIIQEVWNDPTGGLHGLYSKEGAPGFGLNDLWTQAQN